MKKYSISGETSKRILKNWEIEAKDKTEAVAIFRQKANIGISKITHLKIIEK